MTLHRAEEIIQEWYDRPLHFLPAESVCKAYRFICDKAEDKERKCGEWILQPSNKEQGERDFIWWKCSVCGQVIYSEHEHDRREFHRFCGRCGTEMR